MGGWLSPAALPSSSEEVAGTLTAQRRDETGLTGTQFTRLWEREPRGCQPWCLGPAVGSVSACRRVVAL